MLFLKFCSDCGGYLTAKKVQLLDQTLLTLVCSRCGKQESGSLLMGKVIKQDPRLQIVVVSQDNR